MQFKRQLILVTLSLLVILFAWTAASALNLYEQPTENSKITATIAKGQPLMPIYFQGEWVKVADPSNGNVGWVNSKTLSNEGYPAFQIKTFSKETKNGNEQGYQIIQYSSAQPFDQKQMNAMLENFQAQEIEAWAQPILIPMLQPIVLVPEKSDKKN